MRKYIKAKKPPKTKVISTEKFDGFCMENIDGNRRHIPVTDGLNFFWCDICGMVLNGAYITEQDSGLSIKVSQ